MSSWLQLKQILPERLDEYYPVLFPFLFFFLRSNSLTIIYFFYYLVKNRNKHLECLAYHKDLRYISRSFISFELPLPSLLRIILIISRFYNLTPHIGSGKPDLKEKLKVMNRPWLFISLACSSSLDCLLSMLDLNKKRKTAVSFLYMLNLENDMKWKEKV